MTCWTFLDYVLNIRKESPYSYCSNDFFEKSCCQTCKSEFKYLIFDMIQVVIPLDKNFDFIKLRI